MTPMLNIGCGSSFHSDWINLDAAPVSPEVVAHDLRAGLPFPDNHFHAVYASHLLEHLQPEPALRLLGECLRVLKPGGIARIVVPDLETIIRTYLGCLEGALRGDAESQARYDWMMLELYDQAVRTGTGGRMATYLEGALRGDQARFVAGRVGDEAVARPASPANEASMGARMSRGFGAALSAIRKGAAEACAYVFLGPDGAAALREGIFRRRGEVHQWMYDRFSLARAMTRAGFLDIRCRAADESEIADFARYGLETANGRARKPDSLYVEGRKT